MNGLIITLISAGILWVFQSLYKRFFQFRPKLYLSTERVLYNQRLPYMEWYHFEWTCPITIKNNSKHTAFNIRIAILPKHKISDIDPNKLISKNSHMDGFQEIRIETKMEKNVPLEEIRFVTYDDDGVRNITFQTKMQDPQEHFKPNGLKNILILLRYENESGQYFYTLYRKKDGREINRLSLFRPKAYLIE